MRWTEFRRTASFRIAIRYAALFAVSVMVLGGIISWFVIAERIRDLKSVIHQESVSLQSIYERDGWSGLREEIDDQSVGIIDPAVGFHFLLMDKTGVKLTGDLQPVQPFSGWKESTLEEFDKEEGELDTVGISLLSTVFPEGYLVVGRSMHDINEIQEILLNGAGLVIISIIALAFLGGLLFSRGILHWVEGINHAVQRIIHGDIKRRLPIMGVGDELDGLSQNINTMLDRIHELLEGLRQVTNDIAHDLRTPLSRLRHGLVGACERAGSQSSEHGALMRAIWETDGILHTFDSLLSIAEIEAGARRARFTNVDLSSIAEELVDSYRAVAEENMQTLIGDVQQGVEVQGDGGLLTQLLVNLIENAIQHSGSGSRIAVTLRAAKQGFELTVTDTGPGIPQNEREHVLERFYRLEQSRNTPGNGLGLSLVKAISALHGMRLILTGNAPGLVVRVSV